LREMGTNNLEWVDREGRRKKNEIKILGTERCGNIKTVCIVHIEERWTEYQKNKQ
jgi:hypothetical protein